MSEFSSKCPNSRPARLLRSGGLSKSKKAEFTWVIEHFFDEYNEEVGYYGQTLFWSNPQ